MAQKFGPPDKHDDSSIWQYYIVTRFAWIPMYMQGTSIWLKRYYEIYPIDTKTGKIIEMYRTQFPNRPPNETTNS